MATLVPGRSDMMNRKPQAPRTGLTPVPGGGYRLKPEGPLPASRPTEPNAPPRPPGTATPNPPVSQPLNITAQDDPRLTALSERYDKYLDSYEKGAGGAMDLAASRFRDAREGQRAAMTTDAAFRGVPGDLQSYDAATLQGEQKAIADVAAQREAALGENLRGGLGIAAAPGQSNLANREFGLSTWMAQQQQAQQGWENQRGQAQDAFDQFLALLQANRTSPTGGVGTGGGTRYDNRPGSGSVGGFGSSGPYAGGQAKRLGFGG